MNIFIYKVGDLFYWYVSCNTNRVKEWNFNTDNSPADIVPNQIAPGLC